MMPHCILSLPEGPSQFSHLTIIQNLLKIWCQQAQAQFFKNDLGESGIAEENDSDLNVVSPF